MSKPGVINRYFLSCIHFKPAKHQAMPKYWKIHRKLQFNAKTKSKVSHFTECRTKINLGQKIRGEGWVGCSSTVYHVTVQPLSAKRCPRSYWNTHKLHEAELVFSPFYSNLLVCLNSPGSDTFWKKKKERKKIPLPIFRETKSNERCCCGIIIELGTRIACRN